MEYGLIGGKLSHSFSPEIHTRLAGYDYTLCEIEECNLQTFFKNRDFRGINVTIPYKQSVIKYLDYIDDAAKEIGAVNTVVNRGGKLSGFNTDAFGLSSLIKGSGIDISGLKVLILGGGGTSKTALYVAKKAGAKEVLAVSRTKKPGYITYSEALSYHNDADIIINTTPAGMFPEHAACPMDIAPFKSLKAVFDVIYNPLNSRLVLSAKKAGVPAFGGLYMLLMQALRSAELFTDKSIDKTKAEEVYKSLLKSKENIVLVGMPSAGKTEIGKLLSASLDMPFFDSDAEIKAQAGKTPAEIIKTQGEAAFRQIESRVINELSLKNHSVIATGGGAVLREENILNLKANGRVYYIDRQLGFLVSSPGRPLSSSKEAIAKLYKERKDLYETSADKRIENNASLTGAAEKIREDFLL